MEKYEEENLSENEDDPEVYETSSDEWSEGAETKKKGGRGAAPGSGGGGGGAGRRAPARGKKAAKAKAPVESSESEEDDDEDIEEEPKPKSKNGIKRAKLEDSDSSNPAPAKKKSVGGGGGGKGGSDFVNGGFLILKKDAQAGEAKQPCLWRIDGKALLQKYEPFQEDGQLRHRNTSIYTGWSSMDKEMYYPVTVKVLQHQGQNMTVELNWEKLKEICVESE